MGMAEVIDVPELELLVFSESELEQAATVQEANALMKLDQSGIRSLIVDELPMDLILETIGFDGPLTPELAAEVLFEWMFGDTDTTDPSTIDPDSFIGQFFREADKSMLYGEAVGQATVDI